MASLNEVSLIGNLGKDPELRFLPDGKPVIGFSLATNRSWPDASATDGWASETTWWNISQFGDQAERNAEHLRKGDQAFVKGRVKPIRMYTRQDGTVGATLEVDAKLVFKLGKREQDGDDQSAPVSQPPRGSVDLDVDDIPF